MFTHLRYGLGNKEAELHNPHSLLGVKYAMNPNLAWDEGQANIVDSAGNNAAAGGLINPVELSMWYDFTENSCRLQDHYNIASNFDLDDATEDDAWEALNVARYMMECQRDFLCNPNSAYEENCGHDPGGTTNMGCFSDYGTGSQLIYKKFDRLQKIYNKAHRYHGGLAGIGGIYNGGSGNGGYDVGGIPNAYTGSCLTSHIAMPIGDGNSLIDFTNLNVNHRPQMSWSEGSADNSQWCKSGGAAMFDRQMGDNWGIGAPWNQYSGQWFYPFMWATAGRQVLFQNGSVPAGDPFTQYQSCLPTGGTANTVSVTGGGTTITKLNILGHNLNMRDFTCAIVFKPTAYDAVTQPYDDEQVILSIQGTNADLGGSYGLIQYDFGYDHNASVGGSGFYPLIRMRHGFADGTWSVSNQYLHSMGSGTQTDGNGATVQKTLDTDKRNIVIHRVWAKTGPGSAHLYKVPFGNICDTANGTEIYGSTTSRPENANIGGSLGTFNNTGADPIMYMNIPGNTWNSVRVGCGHGTPDGNDEDAGWDGSDRPFEGRVYEILFFRGALNEVGVAKLEAYLKKKHHADATWHPHQYIY